MAKFNVGDTVVLHGKKGRVVWLSENANEIEAIDEYIVEFENNKPEFVVSSPLAPDSGAGPFLGSEQPYAGQDRIGDRDGRHSQTR
jgi:hypothetical protein